jgi:hypothetical protein
MIFDRVICGVDGSDEGIGSLSRTAGFFSLPLQRSMSSSTQAGQSPLRAGPVDALMSASADADLLIVGSKGLHGVKALGSVSERVAHQAQCSVLIVRGV